MSWLEGHKLLDYMDLSNIPPHAVLQSGQLPGGIGHLSDHQAIYVDISRKHPIGLTPYNPIQTSPRFLKSGNKLK